MKEYGIDISSHVPKKITVRMVEWADTIILLDPSLEDRLINSIPETRKKIIIWDIDDPFNTSLENYRKIRDRIRMKVMGLLDNVT